MSIELRGVSYRYPGYRRPAIQDVDLIVGDGEVVGLVGPNEGGKSTLCLVAAGLAPASIGGELSGEILVDGAALSAAPVAGIAGRVGIAFANPASQLSGSAGTVFEEVALGPMNLGLPVAETVRRVRAALRSLGIEDLAERAPDRLSGGQAQLVAIASMVAMGTRNLVLDEPVSELDPDGRRLVGETLRSLARAGTGLLVAEHDLSFLTSIDARLVRIESGRLEAARTAPGQMASPA